MAFYPGCRRRVVVTSSRGAIVFGRGIPGHVYTEADCNSFDDIKIAAYPVSKTLAEKAAWDIYENQPKVRCPCVSSLRDGPNVDIEFQK